MTHFLLFFSFILAVSLLLLFFIYFFVFVDPAPDPVFLEHPLFYNSQQHTELLLHMHLNLSCPYF